MALPYFRLSVPLCLSRSVFVCLPVLCVCVVGVCMECVCGRPDSAKLWLNIGKCVMKIALSFSVARERMEWHRSAVLDWPGLLSFVLPKVQTAFCLSVCLSVSLSLCLFVCLFARPAGGKIFRLWRLWSLSSLVTSRSSSQSLHLAKTGGLNGFRIWFPRASIYFWIFKSIVKVFMTIKLSFFLFSNFFQCRLLVAFPFICVVEALSLYWRHQWTATPAPPPLTHRGFGGFTRLQPVRSLAPPPFFGPLWSLFRPVFILALCLSFP